MTLSQKILSLPIIVSLFMVGLSTVVISRLTNIDTSVKIVTRTLAPQASESAAQMQNFMERDMLVHSYLQTNDQVYVQRFKQLREEALLIAENFRNIGKSTNGTENNVQDDLLDELETRDATYSQIFLNTIVKNNTVANSTASKLLDVTGPNIVKSLSDTIATARSDDKQEIVSAASSALRSFQTARIFVGQFLLSNSASDASRVEMQLLGVDNAFYDLAKLISESRRLALAKNAKNSFDVFSSDFNTIVSAVNARNENLSGVLKNEIESIKQLAISQQIEVWDGLNASGTLVEETVSTTIDNVLITAGLAIFLGMIPAFFVTRNIKSAIQNTVTIANGIAHGELDQDIKTGSKDETGQLLSSLDVMVNQLTHVVSKIQASAKTVKSGASEISKGNQDLSKSTEEQVARLADTSTQVAKLNVTVKQNTSHAIQASDLANAARLRAEDSSKVISNTVAAMADINNSSNEISKIIGLIDDIAFQTNLLALNAAVEAARAGESGRGFAVVATEVRSLAGRSAEAASEIKNLITDSNQNVELGTELVSRSRDSLIEIVTEVTKVSDVVNDIAAASKQQSISIHHVSETIDALNQLTNNNTDLVDKLGSAGRLMSGESEALSGMTEFFKSTKTA